MMDSILIIKYVEKENISLLMEQFIKVNLSIIKCMEKESIVELMDQLIKDIIKMVIVMVKENIFGVMIQLGKEIFMLEIGCTIINMENDIIYMLIDQLIKEIIGLIK